MKERIKYIESLLKKQGENDFGPYRYLVHAVFHTMQLPKLVNLYVETKNLKLKNTLDHHLQNRFKEPALEHKSFFNSLIRKLKKAPYNQHQRIRVLLSFIINYLPKSYTQKYFDFFSSSGYANDLLAALKVTNLVWNSSSDKLFIDKFIETGNENYLEAVINHGKPNEIAKRLKEIWTEDYPADYLKNRIIRKIASEYFEKMAFLKESEPDKFLYVCAFANVNLEDAEIERLFQSLESGQKTFGLWCIGKMNNWEFLKKELKNYI